VFLTKPFSHKTKKNILNLFYSPKMLIDFVFCLKNGLKWDPTWRYYGYPVVKMHKRGSISIGRNFVAVSSNAHNSIGIFQRVVIKTVRPDARILIGNNVEISGCSISSSVSINIGDNVLIGSGCLITDSDAHPLLHNERHDPTKTKCKPIIIKNNVFLGARSIVLKGVTIGCNSVIGAGSVVTKNIPNDCVAAGNPAKVVKQLQY
jgi:acetyltransferase-like isoleucine patch superfamily enzyme